MSVATATVATVKAYLFYIRYNRINLNLEGSWGPVVIDLIQPNVRYDTAWSIVRLKTHTTQQRHNTAWNNTTRHDTTPCHDLPSTKQTTTYQGDISAWHTILPLLMDLYMQDLYLLVEDYHISLYALSCLRHNFENMKSMHPSDSNSRLPELKVKNSEVKSRKQLFESILYETAPVRRY